MAFLLLKGRFSPKLGTPDGDSMRFIPNDPSPLLNLRRRGPPPKINPENGSVQLRYEGIDTLEKRAIAPFSSDATLSNFELTNTSGGTVEALGYICTNQLDPNGRPVCFAFAGEAEDADGTEVFLSADDISTSINAAQMARGHAYPLFYDTLFNDLRERLRSIALQARASQKGVWTADATASGFEWNANLSVIPPIFPKLWRRLDTYSRDETFFDPGNPTANFKAYVEAQGEERVLIVSENRFTGFDDLIEVSDNSIRLLSDPADMVVISVAASTGA